MIGLEPPRCFSVQMEIVMLQSKLIRYVLLAVLMLFILACACSLPGMSGGLPAVQATPSPTGAAPVAEATSTAPNAPAPTGTLPPASATPFAPPTYNEFGVRICDFVPGVSVPAEMPPEVTNPTEPTPYPLPTQPANQSVDQSTIDQQLALYQEIWNTVNTRYYDPAIRGVDWAAIGAKYEALIRAGLTQEDFYLSMQLMIYEIGDEHSHYLNPTEVQEQEAEIAGQNDFVGIGAISLPTAEGDKSILLSIFPGSPAEAAGLRPHDAMLAVDGGPVLDEFGTPRTLGPEGTEVTVTVQRPGQAPRDVTMVRSRVTGAVPIDACIMPEQRIGYIFVPTFLDGTVDEQVEEALVNMTADGELNGLIIDNRMNGGGSGDVAERFLGFFTEGLQGEFVSRQGREQVIIDGQDIGGSQTVPLVVLVSPDTVSYGEITSGILQNSERAIIIGETTLGNVELLRGSQFEDGSLLWVATDTFQPTGLDLGLWEETGIVPSIFAPVRWDLFVEGNDPGLAKAVEVLLP